MTNHQLHQQLTILFKEETRITAILNWHEQQENIPSSALEFVLNELGHHPELASAQKQVLLTDQEYLLTYKIREIGLKTLPEWINPQTRKVAHQVLDKLWLKPERGHLSKILGGKKKELAAKRGYFKSDEERKTVRLEKLQNAIDKGKFAILLGRHTNTYWKLQEKLNETYSDKTNFINDHLWSKYGFTERGMKISNSQLSIIQACETIRRLPHLHLNFPHPNECIILFSLDDYDVRVGMAAIYSDPTILGRKKPQSPLPGIEKPVFSATGLTDLELANIVRNEAWFNLTTFCRTNAQGEAEILTKEQVSREYGIKLISQRMREAVR